MLEILEFSTVQYLALNCQDLQLIALHCEEFIEFSSSALSDQAGKQFIFNSDWKLVQALLCQNLNIFVAMHCQKY